MTKKKKIKTDGTAGSWKSLAPKSSRRPASKAALRKRMLGAGKFLILILILVSAGGVLWLVQNQTKDGAEFIDLTGPGAPVSDISFSTNGVLHKRWFQNWFGPLRDRSLMQLDIERIQSELIKEPQISFARVSRKFPSTLQIELTEQKPILRICLRSKNKGEQTWMVSRDGSLYLGMCYSNASISHLPFLDIRPSLFKRNSSGDGYEKLEGVPAVAPLLELARSEYPGFYQNWQVVSYQRPFDDDPGAHIHIKSRKVKSLRFSPRDFESQLRRLKYLLYEPDFQRTKVVDSIDLSHEESVFVKLTPS